jgi:hypothetical protein
MHTFEPVGDLAVQASQTQPAGAMTRPIVSNSVCLVTPSYWRDLELCELLCESIDRHVTSYAKHYLVVADAEMRLFAKFNGPRREVLPASRLLPPWLRPLPGFLQRKKRRYWWSLRAKPVNGWHVQQLIKLRAACSLPYERFCVLDSDVVFFRPFDLSSYRRPHAIPAFCTLAGVTANAPLHAPWVRASHRLLGLGPAQFPADDFIGHIIFWDQRTVRAMLERIERVMGCEWADALCNARDFSEYLLYGYYLRGDPAHMAQHRATGMLPCLSYWERRTLDVASIHGIIDGADDHHVAISVSSMSETPVQVIRAALSAHAAEPDHVTRRWTSVRADFDAAAGTTTCS